MLLLIFILVNMIFNLDLSGIVFLIFLVGMIVGDSNCNFWVLGFIFILKLFKIFIFKIFDNFFGIIVVVNFKLVNFLILILLIFNIGK